MDKNILLANLIAKKELVLTGNNYSIVSFYV